MGPGLPYDDLDLWLATALPRYALLAATRQARDRGLVASWSPMGVSALIDSDGESFAYLTMKATSPAREAFEFGAVAHGPHAVMAAHRLVAEIRTWDRDHRDTRAELRAYPAGTSDEDLPEGRVLDRTAFPGVRRQLLPDHRPAARQGERVRGQSALQRQSGARRTRDPQRERARAAAALAGGNRQPD